MKNKIKIFVLMSLVLLACEGLIMSCTHAEGGLGVADGYFSYNPNEPGGQPEIPEIPGLVPQEFKDLLLSLYNNNPGDYWAYLITQFQDLGVPDNPNSWTPAQWKQVYDRALELGYDPLG